MSRSESQPVSVPTAGGQLPAHLWLPDAGTGPGLLLLQEIFGVSRYIRQRGADLAAAGYVVLAPELYWRLDAGPLDESSPTVLDEAMQRAQQLDRETTVGDALAALQALRGRDEVRGGAGVIGFCFGGGLGFSVAAADEPDALVSYYGSSLPDQLALAPEVTAPSLHHFGLSDSYIDATTVEAVRTTLTGGPARVEFETYEGAGHAFDNPDPVFHHPEAAALAWRRTLDFLARELPTG